MNTIKIELELPEELAKKAQSVGLFTEGKAISMVERELERGQAAQRLKEWVADVRVSEEGPSLEEIDEEVRAYRRKRREMRANAK
jgi:uncharacterized NAD-dependent epimerase/dehydratase family protein